MALQDKTEAATPHRRSEARKEGKVAKSVDVSSALGLIACLFVLRLGMPYMSREFSAIMSQIFSNAHSMELTPDSVASLAMIYMVKIGVLCAPVMLGAAAVGLASNVSQVGMVIAAKPMAADLNRIDPLKGFVRMFSLRSFVELTKSMAKIAVVSLVVYFTLKGQYAKMGDLAGMSLLQIVGTVGRMSWQLLMRATAAMLAIGALDYLYQRMDYEKSLRMTKQEVKEEYKRMEGDPQVKAQIRRRQLEIARRRQLLDVPKADVVITNPTHIAVALRYDPDEMSAPVVVAKGQRLIAEKIKEIARQHGVPTVENVKVARLLFKVAEVGQAIPEDLYQAVAEILAFVYKISGKRRKAS